MKNIIGPTLLSLRTNAKLSQRNVAIQADITQPQLSKIEQGITDPQWYTVEKILQVLDCDVLTFAEMYLTNEIKTRKQEILNTLSNQE